MSKKGIKQAFKASEYIPQVLKIKDIKLLRQDYTRLRDIMQKRYKRIEKAGIKRTSLQNKIKEWGGEIPKLSILYDKKDIEQSKSRIAYYLAELKKLEESNTTLKEVRKKQSEKQEQLNQAGYNVNNATDLDDFIDFLDYMEATDNDMLLYGDSSGNNVKESGKERDPETKKRINKYFKIWKDNKRSLPVEIILSKER